ncbi:MAG: serine hydrolase domain-containing protein [Deltaproteobacteria bacterium]
MRHCSPTTEHAAVNSGAATPQRDPIAVFAIRAGRTESRRVGKVLLHEAVGWADKEHGVAMKVDSILPIASSTKLVTMVAALRLFEANRLHIMAPVASYLPELANLRVARRDAEGNFTSESVPASRQPTVHDLMTEPVQPRAHQRRRPGFPRQRDRLVVATAPLRRLRGAR